MNAAAQASLYERIGGEPAVMETVLSLYERILTDPELTPFFEGIDIQKLRHSQRAFVICAFGGPNHYSGKSMRAAHAPYVQQGLNAQHFNRVVAHFKASLEELNVPPDLIAEALAIVESTRADVLNT